MYPKHTQTRTHTGTDTHTPTHKHTHGSLEEKSLPFEALSLSITSESTFLSVVSIVNLRAEQVDLWGRHS